MPTSVRPREQILCSLGGACLPFVTMKYYFKLTGRRTMKVDTDSMSQLLKTFTSFLEASHILVLYKRYGQPEHALKVTRTFPAGSLVCPPMLSLAAAIDSDSCRPCLSLPPAIRPRSRSLVTTRQTGKSPTTCSLRRHLSTHGSCSVPCTRKIIPARSYEALQRLVPRTES